MKQKKLGGICPCKFTATFATHSHGLFAWYSFDTTKRHLMCFLHVCITCLRDNERPLKQDIFVTHVTKSLPDDFLDSSHNTAVHLINTKSWNSSLSSQHHVATHSISSLRLATTSKVQIRAVFDELWQSHNQTNCNSQSTQNKISQLANKNSE